VDYLIRVLTGPEKAARVTRAIQTQRILVRDYLLQLADGEKRVAMVDVGYSGTIPRMLEAILRDEADRPSLFSFLAISATRLLNGVMEGADLRAFVGPMGVEEVSTEKFCRSPEFLEQLLSAEAGSTHGYRRNECGEILPELGKCHAGAFELRVRRYAQQGIMHWVRLVRAVRPVSQTSWLTASPVRYFEIYSRHISLPSREEARRIGSLSHDYGAGEDGFEALCSPRAAQELQARGPSNFLAWSAYRFPSRIFWPEGVVAAHDPAHLMLERLRHHERDEFIPITALLNAVAAMREMGLSPCLVYGASDLGVVATRYLSLLSIEIAGIVDRNPTLNGALLRGCRVVHPSQASRLGPFASVLVAATGHAASIIKDVAAGILGVSHPLVLFAPYSEQGSEGILVGGFEEKAAG
jgi:hypothetical protein